MSNTSPSSGVLNLSRPALIFIVLMLTLGALLLATTQVEQRAVVRAQFTLTPSLTFTPSITPTPIDPFAELSYVSWTSPDGLISLEHPQLWIPQASPQNGPAAYVLAAPGAQTTGILVLGLPASQLAAPNLPANPSPADYIRALVPDAPPEQIVSATVAGLNGAHIKQTLPQQDPRTGQTTLNVDRDFYLLTLDAQNFFVVQAIAPTSDWSKMQPVLERALTTLKLNTQGIIALITRASSPPPVATATQVAPTQAATAEATQAATAAPTQQATAEPTGVATAEATAAPTETH